MELKPKKTKSPTPSGGTAATARTISISLTSGDAAKIPMQKVQAAKQQSQPKCGPKSKGKDVCDSERADSYAYAKVGYIRGCGVQKTSGGDAPIHALDRHTIPRKHFYYICGALFGLLFVFGLSIAIGIPVFVDRVSELKQRLILLEHGVTKCLKPGNRMSKSKNEFYYQ